MVNFEQRSFDREQYLAYANYATFVWTHRDVYVKWAEAIFGPYSYFARFNACVVFGRGVVDNLLCD